MQRGVLIGPIRGKVYFFFGLVQLEKGMARRVGTGNSMLILD